MPVSVDKDRGSEGKKEKNGKKEREEEGRGRKKTLNILSLNS